MKRAKQLSIIRKKIDQLILGSKNIVNPDISELQDFEKVYDIIEDSFWCSLDKKDYLSLKSWPIFSTTFDCDDSKIYYGFLRERPHCTFKAFSDDIPLFFELIGKENLKRILFDMEVLFNLLNDKIELQISQHSIIYGGQIECMGTDNIDFDISDFHDILYMIGFIVNLMNMGKSLKYDVYYVASWNLHDNDIVDVNYIRRYINNISGSFSFDCLNDMYTLYQEDIEKESYTGKEILEMGYNIINIKFNDIRSVPIMGG